MDKDTKLSYDSALLGWWCAMCTCSEDSLQPYEPDDDVKPAYARRQPVLVISYDKP